ncbi:phosphoribosyltransferase family protein [Litchfieldella xinjiangensis]|uniref:phosphoribosyltransferase family protein n=1 Tax=Litchfieldella xinjiangensis TaxID=1166948 RepID=UPI0005B9EC30|nr:phosphoribosyltransferase [Halomonas xinjiangensis]
MIYKTYENLSHDIRNHLPSLQAHKFDLIVGVPRSGMIPAYMIALYLNISCVDLPTFLNNGSIANGKTRKSSRTVALAQNAKRVLLVDDSIMSGREMRFAKEKVDAVYAGTVTTLAIYSSLKNRSDIDLFLEYVPKPRTFEWNLFHRSSIEHACISLDALFCRPNESRVDSARILSGELEPAFIPSYRIGHLLAEFPISLRHDVETMLERYGIDHGQIHWLPDAMNTADEIVAWKARTYGEIGAKFAIEFNDRTAAEMATLTGKPVLAIGNSEIFRGPFLRGLSHQAPNWWAGLKHRSQFFPSPIKVCLRFLFRQFKRLNL